MNIKLKSRQVALLMAGATASLAAFAGCANASVTEYTSQAAFDAAAPTATTFGFTAPPTFAVEPNPVSFHGLSFKDNVTLADTLNGGVPIIFLISAAFNPNYGQDFLAYQNTDVGISAEIDSAGTTAIGFDFGSYVAPSAATITLSTGDTFAILPSTTAQFVGFTSTSPITSVTIDYPAGFTFDLVSVSSIAAIPEVSTWALMLIGFGAVGASLRRRRNPAAATA